MSTILTRAATGSGHGEIHELKKRSDDKSDTEILRSGPQTLYFRFFCSNKITK